jgi:CRP-like cAMP-binding protein
LLSLFGEADQHTRVEAGQKIFSRGDLGDSMYVIIDGTVNLHDGDDVYGPLAAGELFGEMSLIDDEPRSLDAVAATDATLAEIDERRFLFLVNETPMFALHVMGVLADRLRDRP